ncbi:MAG: glycoside hydrolase family 3 N-terminal domain-containing protein, partial [Hyphomicrobium sp.]
MTLGCAIGAVHASPAIAAEAGAAASMGNLHDRVLAADPTRLEKLGRHLMAGIDDMAEVRRLIEAKAIAGVFVTRRNLRGRTAAAIRAEIESLQALRRTTGLPPLWIAADQEGGLVQRLSPPLPRQQPLSRIVASHAVPAERKAAVLDYAWRQGAALAAIGVTVNFAPVVDIDHGLRNPRDAHTRIGRRALGRDALAVAEAASWYCDGLRDAGVTCTRKHFPGLGRVLVDTHVAQATLDGPLRRLSTSDWVPFAQPAGSTMADWTMLGHVRVNGLDPDTPASASKAVVDLLRQELNVSGIVITDDFSMGAIQKSTLGTGGAAVAALNAGVDLVLVSFFPREIYVVLEALLAADVEGRLDAAKLRSS